MMARLMPFFSAEISEGKTPRVSRKVPSNESSPINTVSLILKSNPFATSNAIAIGKSNAEPLFGNQAGVSETITFRFGQICPELINADLTRSRDSKSAASGKPSKAKVGNPSPISTSTEINSPVKPVNAMALVRAKVI